MTSPEERIRSLARDHAIDDDDAARLLAAVRPEPPRASRLNPFARWSGERTAVAGVLIAIAGVATSRLGVRYDGAIDLHVSSSVPVTRAVLDQLVAFPLTALVFYFVARLIALHVRFVDVLGTVGLSRAPAVVGAVPIVLLSPLIQGNPTKPGLALLALTVVALAILGVQITLLVLGFRTSTGARGGWLASSFIGALVGAEILSKVVLSQIPL